MAGNLKAVKVFPIIKEGLLLWKENFFPFSAMYLLLFVPMAILATLLLVIANSASPSIWQTWLAAFILIINTVLYFWSEIAFISAANQAVKKEKIIVLNSVAGARRFFFPYVGTSLLCVMILGGLFLLGLATSLGAGLITSLLYKNLGGAAKTTSLIIGTILIIAIIVVAVCYFVYFTIRLLLSSFACILEEKRPVEALKRSFALIKKYVNPTLGVFAALVCVSVILYLIPTLGIISILKEAQQQNIATKVLQYIAGFFLVPFGRLSLVRLYQQLKEANET